MSKYFKLVFKSSGDKTVALNVTDADDSISEDTIKNAMDAIMASKALASPSGNLVGRVSAELIETTANVITM